MCGGGGSNSDGPGGTSGGMGGGFGGMGSGMNRAGGDTSSDTAGNATGRSGGGFGRGGGDGGNTPSGLRSAEDAHRGLSIAGPQLSRARDNAAATNVARGLTALGVVTGFPGFSIASALTKAARDYGRGYAERTNMERAADALGMGAAQRGSDSVSSGLGGAVRPMAKAPAKAPAKAAASGNVGSGSSGATVIMGAEKTRTGAGAGGRAKGSAVRGFGSGGLKL